MLNAYTHFKRENTQNINAPYTVSFFSFFLVFAKLFRYARRPPPPKKQTNKLTNKQKNQTNT